MSAVLVTLTKVIDAVDTALGDLTTHRNTVPERPSFPYVLISYTLPRVSERALTREPHSFQHRFRTTLVGTSTNSVEFLGGRVVPALEGTRFTVAGWQLSPLESVPNSQPIQPDYDVTTPDDLHPLYAVLDWVVTGSRRP